MVCDSDAKVWIGTVDGAFDSHTALTDTVLTSLLFHLDLIVDYIDRGAGGDEALAMAMTAFAEDWERHCGEIDELVEVFGSVPDACEHSRWDELRGLLQHSRD